MSHADTLESYMLRMELPHEQVSDDTWVVAPNSLRHARIIVRIDDPIVLYSTPLFGVTDDAPDLMTYIVLGYDFGTARDEALAPISTKSR